MRQFIAAPVQYGFLTRGRVTLLYQEYVNYELLCICLCLSVGQKKAVAAS